MLNKTIHDEKKEDKAAAAARLTQAYDIAAIKRQSNYDSLILVFVLTAVLIVVLVCIDIYNFNFDTASNDL